MLLSVPLVDVKLKHKYEKSNSQSCASASAYEHFYQQTCFRICVLFVRTEPNRNIT
jgi:hypothetical protein